MPGGVRPTGITIICVLGFILSLLTLIVGMAAIGIGAVAGSFLGDAGGVLGAIFGAIGIIFLILGVAGLVAFYLLLKMKKTGWILVTIIGILSIVMGALSLSTSSLVTIILWLVIIVYLWTKRRLFD